MTKKTIFAVVMILSAVIGLAYSQVALATPTGIEFESDSKKKTKESVKGYADIKTTIESKTSLKFSGSDGTFSYEKEFIQDEDTLTTDQKDAVKTTCNFDLHYFVQYTSTSVLDRYYLVGDGKCVLDDNGLVTETSLVGTAIWVTDYHDPTIIDNVSGIFGYEYGEATIIP